MVNYRGPIPDRVYNLSDFLSKNIILSWKIRFKTDNKPSLRAVFRSNGLIGEIRSCGNTLAIDVRWGWWTDQQSCITTECKNMKEAKSILYMWFKSKGYTLPKSETQSDWSKGYLSLPDIQLKMFI
jgi:hypothetical protein